MLSLERTETHPRDTIVLHEDGAIIGTIKVLRIRRGRDGGPPTVRLGFNFPRSIVIDRIEHYQPKGHKNVSNGNEKEKEQSTENRKAD